MWAALPVDLANRLYEHLIHGKSNAHLQFAIAKYSLAAFSFKVLEFCAKSQLLEREQFFEALTLNRLFALASLPSDTISYRLLLLSSLGYTHSFNEI